MAHTQYTSTGKIHTFRGLLADGGQERVRIQGATGEIAWRINKLEIIGIRPSSTVQESTVKIYREKQDSVTDSIDLSDTNLLAVAYRETYSSSTGGGDESVIIVVTDLFARNIYVTHEDGSSGGACNYYIELEEVKVSKAGMAQLAVAAARRLSV